MSRAAKRLSLTLFGASVTLDIANAWWHHRVALWLVGQLILIILAFALAFLRGFVTGLVTGLREHRKRKRS